MYNKSTIFMIANITTMGEFKINLKTKIPPLYSTLPVDLRLYTEVR